MTIKMTMIQALEKAGYDTLTACEHAQKKINELTAAPPGTYKICAGTLLLTIRRR